MHDRRLYVVFVSFRQLALFNPNCTTQDQGMAGYNDPLDNAHIIGRLDYVGR